MKKRRIFKIAFAVILLAVAVLAGYTAIVWNAVDIPRLYLEGNIKEMWEKSDVRQVSFVYEDGSDTVSGFAEIKIQGTSSIDFVKKNYTLKFFEDEALENKLKIDVGWGPQNKYCMKANWIDRTHARNVVTARLAAKMQAKYDLLTQAPNNGLIDGFPVEIYDNGAFLGLYTFNIPKDTWQFGMDKEDPNHIVICGEGWDEANLFNAMPDFETWAVEVGEESEVTLEKMNRLFDFVMNSSDEEFKADFEEYLNLDSALNYYVMADLAYLEDNLGKNMLIATYDGMVWYLSLYDLDSSWGTNPQGTGTLSYKGNLLNMSRNTLFRRMEQAFPEELAQRYFELRGDVLSNENIMAEFGAFADQVPSMTFLKEIQRWCTGLFRTRSELPGADYGQIRDYLKSVSQRLDDKYVAWLPNS